MQKVISPLLSIIGALFISIVSGVFSADINNISTNLILKLLLIFIHAIGFKIAIIISFIIITIPIFMLFIFLYSVVNIKHRKGKDDLVFLFYLSVSIPFFMMILTEMFKLENKLTEISSICYDVGFQIGIFFIIYIILQTILAVIYIKIRENNK